MALPKQTIDIPIVGGHDEKTDSHAAVNLRTLINGRYRKTGAIEKRYGNTIVINGSSAGTDVPIRSAVTAASVATLASVHPYGSKVVACGGGKLYTAPLSTSASRWNYCTRLTDVTVDRETVTQMFPQCLNPDVAIDASGTYLAYTWTDATASANVYAMVVRADTGAVIGAPTVVGTANSASKVTWCTDGTDTFAVVVWRSTTVANIQASKCTLSTTTKLTWSSATNLITDADSFNNLAFDIATISGGDLAIIYERSTPRVTLKTWDVSPAGFSLANTTTTTGTDSDIWAFALHYDPNNGIWYGWTWVTGGVGQVRGGRFNSNGSLETVATATVLNGATANPHLHLGICAVSSTEATYVASRGELVANYAGTSICNLTTSGTVTASAERYNTFAVSRPWQYDSRQFVLATVERGRPGSAPGWPSINDTYYHDTVVMEIPGSAATSTMDAVPRAITAPRLGVWARSQSALSSVVATATGEYVATFTVVADTDARRPTVEKASISFNNAKKRQAVEVNGTLYLTGGLLTSFDGTNACEVGFIEKPVILSQTSPVGGSATAGDHTAYLAWEWVDAAGNLHLSEPSAVSSTNTLAANDLFATVNYACHVTNKVNTETTSPNIYHILYMSAASGSTYYRAHALSVTGCTKGDANVKTTATVTGAGTGPADADLATQALLYTTGGANPPVVPPSCKLIAHHKGRLWIDSDTGAIWVTPIVTEGLIAQFHDAFVIAPFEGGRPTALASLDDALIVFKESSIYAIYGDGPTTSGSPGTDTADPKLISSDGGCIDPRSVVRVPDGLMYQGRGGIFLLTRGMQVVPIGKPIETTLASYPTCTSAVLVSSQNEVRFTLTTSTGSTGVRAAYDYISGTWATDTLYDVVSTSTIAPAVGSFAVNGTYWWVTGKSMYYEDTTLYTDALTWVTLTFTTGRIHVAGMAGFQRAYRLGLLAKYGTDCGFSVSVGYDYNTFESAGTFAAGTFSSPVVNAQFHLAKQKCEAVTFSYSDTASATLGTGKGFTVTGLTLEIGTKGKAARNLPATKRA